MPFTSHASKSRTEADTGPGPSQLLWKPFPSLSQLIDYPNMGHFWDMNQHRIKQTLSITTAAAHGQYWVRSDTNCGTRYAIDEATGNVVELFCANTDNNESYAQWAGANGAPFVIAGKGTSQTAGYPPICSLAYEIGVKVSSIADDQAAWFAGLAEEGTATDNMLVDDTGAMVDKDYIGFHVVHENGGATNANSLVNFVFNKAGGSGPITKIAAVATLVADTWVKLGFRHGFFDGSYSDAEAIQIFVNGVMQSTFVVNGTGTGEMRDSANPFPNAEELAPCIGMKVGSAAAPVVRFRNGRCIQLAA